NDGVTHLVEQRGAPLPVVRVGETIDGQHARLEVALAQDVIERRNYYPVRAKPPGGGPVAQVVPLEQATQVLVRPGFPPHLALQQLAKAHTTSPALPLQLDTWAGGPRGRPGPGVPPQRIGFSSCTLR